MSNADVQKGLSYDEAVRVLGYEPGEVVAPHIPAFRSVEEKLGSLIETSRDEQFKTRLRGEQARLSEALEVLEAAPAPVEALPKKGSPVWVWVSLMLVGCLVGLAWIGNTWVVQKREAVRDEMIGALLKEGDAALEKRRWPEAKAIYEDVMAIRPNFAGALDGMRRIEEGKAEERRQQIGFLAGTAQAAIEARRWDEAESACRDLRELDPGNKKMGSFLASIESGRMIDRIVSLLDAAEEAIREEDWENLSLHAKQLETIAPTHVDLPRLKSMSVDGMKLLEERRAKARELYQRALAMDDGTFSQEALEILREAMRLADRPEYKGLYDKLSAYARTLNVPGEFETVSEALAAARPNDKVRVAAGTYAEALVIPGEIELEGAGPGKTIFECDGSEASVVVVPRESRGSRLAGLTVRQTGIVLTDERYPVVAVDGGTLAIDNCAIVNGSGHGVAVVNGGEVSLVDVRVEKCGWDGLAVYGDGSRAEANGSRFDENLHHGIDAWDGGAVTIVRCRSFSNGLAGIVLMSPGVSSEVEGTTCDENRELGILVANGTTADLNGNQLTSNLLGGILVRDANTSVSVVKNRILKNGTAGVVVDKRANLVRFADNEVLQNGGEQVKLEADIKDETVPQPDPVEAPRVVPLPEVPEEVTLPAPPSEEPALPAPAESTEPVEEPE